jgi:hypothetical protein
LYLEIYYGRILSSTMGIFVHKEILS